eukprot:TRINITY_DN24295_c0_g1_i1.p2 TRINITY_DN24295_c0_g1~~TRINITY_DN24295_c0_g1_i1.p2  ORF type:complete len:116 (-),score=23.39 TRINITY_DN24295_c0_g1_i1:830-1177(-)
MAEMQKSMLAQQSASMHSASSGSNSNNAPPRPERIQQQSNAEKIAELRSVMDAIKAELVSLEAGEGVEIVTPQPKRNRSDDSSLAKGPEKKQKLDLSKFRTLTSMFQRTDKDEQN